MAEMVPDELFVLIEHVLDAITDRIKLHFKSFLRHGLGSEHRRKHVSR